MEDEEELDSGRARLPRWLRLGAVLVAGLAVAAVITVRAWPRSGSPPRAATSTSPTPASSSSPPGSPSSEPRQLPPWPTAPGACGTDVPLPILSTTRTAERTDIHLLVGGSALRVADFDGGRAGQLGGAKLRPGVYVVGLYPESGSKTYAVTLSGCQGTGTSRVLRIEAGGRTSAVASLTPADTLFTDGQRAWIARSPTGGHDEYGSITPLGGGPSVRLPRWVYPFGAVSGLIVAQREDGQDCPCSLVLLDAATGHIQTKLGADADLIATGAGEVVWAEGCDATLDTACTLHVRRIATAATRTYRLPRPTFGGVLSPDGRQVALLLERAGQDPRFAGHPIPPSDIAILHLDTGRLGTGRLDIAPGIEVPAKTAPQMTFTADGHWLALAFDAGRTTRLLAWHPGLARPYESAPIVAGTGWGAPPIMAIQ